MTTAISKAKGQAFYDIQRVRIAIGNRVARALEFDNAHLTKEEKAAGFELLFEYLIIGQGKVAQVLCQDDLSFKNVGFLKIGLPYILHV